MIDEALLEAAMAGDALAVMARDRWADYARAPGLRFADALDVAGLRAGRPDWRATSLAPVDIVDDPWTLPSIPDRSLDCLIALHGLIDPARVETALATAGRVLRPGGSMLLVVPDERYASRVTPDAAALYAALDELEATLGGDGAGTPWAADRIVRLIGRLPRAWLGALEFEFAGRRGADLVVVFALGGVGRHAMGTLLEHDGRIYVVDGRCIRHILSPDVLAMLGDARPPQTLLRGDYARLVAGRPLRAADVPDLLLRRDGTRAA